MMTTRVLGLIGGISWESTAHYYRLINEGVRAAKGPSCSADLRLHSFDFATISALQHEGDWPALEQRMVLAAQGLAAAGANGLLICANTMHRLADAVVQATGLPLIHIADPVAAAVRARGQRRVLLLGTAFTMEQPFLVERLRSAGLDVRVPGPEDRAAVHRIIYDELVAGVVREASRQRLAEVIARGITEGAEGVILGCTELMMIVRPEDSAVPLFDTTALHAEAAVAWLLGSGEA